METDIIYSGNTKSNVIIITLHGGPGKGYGYLKNSTAFKQLETEFLIVYYNQIGCQIKELIEGITEKMLIDNINDVLDKVKSKYPNRIYILLGISFGGFLGFDYISNSINNIDAYIAGCPAICFQKEQAIKRKNLYSQSLNIISNYGNEVLFDKDNYIKILNDDNISYSTKYLFSIQEWFFSKTFQQTFDTTNLDILILQGKEDTICPYRIIEHAVQIANNKNIKLCLYDNTKHDIFNQAEKLFVSDIISFCSKYK